MIQDDILQVRGIDPALLKEFERMCRENEWTQSRVIAFLVEGAVDKGAGLAAPLHRWTRKRSENKWKAKETDE